MNSFISKNTIFGGMVAGIILVVAVCIPQIFENVDAGTVVVIQSPISGELIVHTEQGLKWQGFGKVTTYPRREQFSFSSLNDQGKKLDESVPTRFNDGGHGNISGTMNWSMPLAASAVIKLHKDFGSFGAIEQQLIRPAMQKVIYNVGPTMSSTESSAEKRPDIPKYIDDQLSHGPYLTKTVSNKIVDELTGKERTVNTVIIALDEKGQPLRESESPLSTYNIQIQPVAINGIKYDDVVENQIKERQKSTTQVQIAIANSKRAEQDALTAAKEGEAKAAKAKWAQEEIKAKVVTEAEQKLAVATLGAKEAEQYKKEQILRGEGDAQAKALRMNADGALDTKLEAYVKVQTAYAEAMGKYQGAWVPSVVMGQGNGNAGSGAQALVEMLSAKTARELGLDLAVKGQQATKKQ